MTKADKTIAELEKQGWIFDHSALFKTYKYSGSTSSMQPRKGYEYIRVHEGRCKNIQCGEYWKCMQITYVMRRKAN